MTGFLGEIGGKLADRWAALLALPGFLFLAAATAAAVLGQRDAVSYPDMSRQVSAWAASPALKSTGGAVLVAAAVLAGSVFAGLVATAGGKLVEILWTLPGHRPPARWLADWRRKRSKDAKERAETAATPAALDKAIRQANRICVIEADCPTWIGDRLRACHVRVSKTYGLDLSAIWPRLWLIVPDSTRTELGAAQDALSSAARLGAWAFLYLLLAAWWWPAFPIAAVVAISAAVKGRMAAATLADLVEATVDLHGGELAAQLGVPGPLTPASGMLVTLRTGKSRWDPASPMAN